MVPKKPVDVQPLEMLGGLFGAAKTDKKAPTGMRGWLARREANVATFFAGTAWRWVWQVSCVAVVVAGGVAGWKWRDTVGEKTANFVAQSTGAVVDRIEVTGSVYTTREQLQEALGLKKGDSLVGFDAGRARARIENLPWVRLASVERQLPDTVKIAIYEHVPLARVVAEGKIWVINKDGERIVADDGNQFAGLPLLQGEGAATSAGALFAALTGWPQLVSQLREAQWMGGRRWDLRFASGVVVQLPEDNMPAALPLLAKLEEARHVLTLNAGQVDLRLPDRVVLRLPDTVGPTPVTNAPAAQG